MFSVFIFIFCFNWILIIAQNFFHYFFVFSILFVQLDHFGLREHWIIKWSCGHWNIFCLLLSSTHFFHLMFAIFMNYFLFCKPPKNTSKHSLIYFHFICFKSIKIISLVYFLWDSITLFYSYFQYKILFPTSYIHAESRIGRGQNQHICG